METDFREEIIDGLMNSQQSVSDLLLSVASQQDCQSDPAEWSFRFIAAHMAVAEKEAFYERVQSIAAGEQPHYLSYWNKGRDFSSYDLKGSLKDWGDTRKQIVQFVRALSVEQLALTGTHDTFGVITVLDTLRIMYEHDLGHLENLQQILKEKILFSND